MAIKWTIEYASGESSSTTGKTFPTDGANGSTTAAWLQCIGPGTVVAVCEGGQVFTRHAVGGEVYKGSFTALTSTTCQYLVMGNGPPPPAIPQGTTAAGVTIADAGSFTAATTTEAALQEIYQDLKSNLEIIHLRPAEFTLLADGTPLAVWASATTTTPGLYSDGAKAFGIRWNNDAAPAAVIASFQIPPEVDVTADAVVHIRAAKTSATNNAGNTPTFVVTAANQVDGALYDADTNFGGTSSAMLPAATAKTIQNVTRTLALADLAAYPASVSLSVKPTAGTLDTDDLVLFDVYLVCKRKLRTS